MRKFAIVAAGLLLSSAAFAQSATSSQPQQSPSTPSPQVQGSQQPTQGKQQSTAQIAQEIRQNLQKAGFKNIRLMPSSFLVRAEDQNNNPVMMVINPDSITEVSATQLNPGSNDQGTVGQGSAPSSNSDSTNSSKQAAH